MLLTCPHCKAEHDCLDNMTGSGGPKKDDINICFDCLMVSLFNEDRTLRIPSLQELDDLSESNKQEILRIQSASRIVKARK